MSFIHDGFLLNGKVARRLYETHARPQPIFDYHNHLPPRDIAANRTFRNLFEIWLEGDHYKWRAMRANGVPERFCTGDAAPYEKFKAWAATVPRCLRNPLYHWTHLELKRYFDIDELLDETTAERVWARANEQLQSGDLTARGILAKFGVKVLCTTDDPGRRSDEPRRDPRRADRHARLPDVPPGPRAGRPPAGDVQPLDRAAVRGRRCPDRARSPTCSTRSASATRTSTTRAAAPPTTGCRAARSSSPSERAAAATFEKARAGAADHA